MGAFSAELSPFFQWLVKASLQGSLLICLILLIRFILRGRLPIRWHYYLWLVLLVRLSLPWSPESRLSIYNLYQPSRWGGPTQSVAENAGMEATAARQAEGSRQTQPKTAAGADTVPRPGAQAAFDSPHQRFTMPPEEGDRTSAHWKIMLAALPVFWLAGVVALGGYVLVRNIWLWRAVKQERALTNQQILDLLEDCKMQMRVQTIVGVVVTDQIKSPALFGFVRPRILLPQGLIETLGLDELHYVLLHELAHLKRRDIYLAWLVCLLQVLHWYNPLMWFAFGRMRADQEMAADALALSAAGTDESRLYGQTIVNLLERFSRPQYLPSLAGILENPSHIERRIQMIAKFKGTTCRPLLAMVVLAVLGLITLTEAQNKSEGGKPASQPEEKTGLAPDRNAPVAPQVTGVSATETASLGGGLVTRRVLTDASGVGGVLTADGKYIRGIDWETGDVVQFEVASSQTSRITNRGPWTGNALHNQAFSRDGKQIAYDVESSDPNTKDWVYQVRIRNLDGSGLRTLYSQKDSLVYPLDWSPDAGSILALREDNKASELTLISTADGSVRVLRSSSGFQRASFSPDGRFVAFTSQEDVFLMIADGRDEVVVAGHPAKDRLLGWTPDGRSLVFLSDRSGTWDIWTVHITGGKQQGEPELLKKDFGYDSEVLGFAPDGSLYYKTDTSFGHLYHGAVDLETGKVLVPPAPVTTRYTSQPHQLTWSPDGRNLLYISNWGWGPGQDILTIRSAATGKERLLSGLGFVNMISWAPDSRSVIALGTTEGKIGIVRIDTETSGITKLAPHPGLFPKLCPDGKTLVFASGPIIRKRNLDTGEESEVVNVGTGGTAQWYYDLSPDGREVVFQVDGAVKTVSLNGGEPRELFRGSAKYYRMRWTGDGRYIIAQAASFGGSDATGIASTEIWRVPAQGGTPLKLDLSVPKLAFFALHPDNRRFAFSVNEGSKSELWVMENFLPGAGANQGE